MGIPDQILKDVHAPQDSGLPQNQEPRKSLHDKQERIIRVDRLKSLLLI